MSSSGVDRRGGPPRPDPRPGKKEDTDGALSDDDNIEIIEVVGMAEDADRPRAEVVPHSGTGDAGDGIAAAPAAAPKTAGTGQDQEPLREMLLRSRADFENFRKRSAREMEKARANGSAALMGRLLPVLDNLERALRSDAPADDPLRHGIEMVLQQLLDILSREGLNPIDTRGARFDPHQHEAVEMVNSDGSEEGTIVQELQKGYTVKERLLRPALVKVASGKNGEAVGSGEAPAG